MMNLDKKKCTYTEIFSYIISRYAPSSKATVIVEDGNTSRQDFTLKFLTADKGKMY